MNGSRLNWVKKNSETAVCFVLFLGLVFISVYFMRLEKRRTALVNAGTTFAGISRSREVEFSSRQTNFLGLLTPKPISYYNLIVRRNPFASLPVFEPPEELKAPEVIELPVEISTEELPPTPLPERITLVLSGTIFLLEQGWVAQIENFRTGEIHFVREGEIIANIFKVKKIERNRVILGREGKEDIELKLGKR